MTQGKGPIAVMGDGTVGTTGGQINPLGVKWNVLAQGKPIAIVNFNILGALPEIELCSACWGLCPDCLPFATEGSLGVHAGGIFPVHTGGDLRVCGHFTQPLGNQTVWIT